MGGPRHQRGLPDGVVRWTPFDGHPDWPALRGRAKEDALMGAVRRRLSISESCLRRWMSQADIDAGREEGLSSDERAELPACHVFLRNEGATIRGARSARW